MVGIRSLRKSFSAPKHGRVFAIDNINFQVDQGKFFTLLGPSGCGKSTTLRSIAGLERPEEGEITIGKHLVFSSEKRTFVPTNKRPIGMVFQSYAIWPHMTVFGNVAYPLEVKGLSKDQIKKKVNEALELVGLGGVGDRPAPRLSGGQQQRVALARALVSEPEVLLLDEPLSNLDAKLRAHMRTELKNLQLRIGVTALYVTHDQHEALAMSDEIGVMNNGVIVQVGTPSDIYFKPRNRFVAEFIGTANFVGGQVDATTLQPGLNKVQTNLGPLLASAHEPLSVPDRTVTLSIRPEVITIGDAVAGATDLPATNKLKGRVESAIFLGESVEYAIRVGEQLIRVKGGSTGTYANGREVTLRVPAEFCTLLAERDGKSDAALLDVAAASERPAIGSG